MDTDKANKWLSLIANLGVLAGLVFVAIELNQNTKATVSSASEQITNQSLDYFALGMDNQVIALARYKQSIGDELSGFERDQLWWHQYYNFRGFENVYLQYKRGYVEQTEWDRYRRIINFRLTTDEIALKMWEDTQPRWTDEFTDEVERLR
jgi:uncharacterized protein YraI